MAAKALSLIVADSIREEVGGKLFIVGLYTHVEMDEPPTEDDSHGLSVMAHVLGLEEGEHSVELEIFDIDGEQRLSAGPETVISTSERKITRVLMHITDFYFPTSGRYVFNLLINKDKVAEHIAVVSFPSGDEEDADEADEAALGDGDLNEASEAE